MSASPQQILAAFDAAATERSINLPAKAYGAGSALWEMPHAGIPTFMVLSFAGTLTRTDGASVGTVTASPFWPYNILAPSSFYDYLGTQRIFADGWDLYVEELVKNYAAHPNNPFEAMPYAASIYNAAIPAGVINSPVSGPITFGVVIPISYLKASVLGSYIGTLPNGTARYQLQENALTGNTIAAPLTVAGGTTVALTGTWNLTYYFSDAPSTVQVPVAAMQQVHELFRQQDSANLQAGANFDSDLLTGRTYYRVLQTVIENNVPSFMDVSAVQFLIDSSTLTMDENLIPYLVRTRMEYGRDFPPGLLVRDFTAKPVTPDSYGSLAARNKLDTGFAAGSFANVVTLRECLYVPSSANLIQVQGQ